MKIMRQFEYERKPKNYRATRKGVPYLLYLGENGTTWGPVRLITQLPPELRMEDVAGASYDVLRQIGEGESGYRAFVWLGEDPDEFEPLIVDAFTASAMMQVHDALSEEQQRKFEAMVSKSRSTFGTLVDFTWRVSEANVDGR